MHIQTPIGPLWLDANQVGLTRVSFSERTESSQANQDILALAASQLAAYFAGTRQKFDLPLFFESGTPFQQAVWRALQEIPYGTTTSYSEVAVAIHREKAVRAIGQANRCNPLPILIPCHRVIGKNGTLTGYLGAGEKGLAIKRHLLALEQANRPIVLLD